MGHTLMRILTATAAALAIIIAALWWLRAWAQYKADETVMAAAMHTRNTRDSTWDNDCT
jgi:hypothetical protein